MRTRDVEKNARALAREYTAELTALLEAHKSGLDVSEHISDPAFGDDRRYLSIYMGTVFALTPSGKVYTPWASSNVDGCKWCKGKGCKYCGHTGSREAYLDEVWQETLDEAFGKAGYWTESGEGDPCDLFACAPLPDEDEDESDEEVTP